MIFSLPTFVSNAICICGSDYRVMRRDNDPEGVNYFFIPMGDCLPIHLFVVCFILYTALDQLLRSTTERSATSTPLSVVVLLFRRWSEKLAGRGTLRFLLCIEPRLVISKECHLTRNTPTTPLILVFVVVVVLFLLFDGGVMNGRMMNGGVNGNEWMDERSRMWTPALPTLGLVPGWILFEKKE